MAKLASDVVYSTGFFNKSKMFIEAEVLHINESIIWKLFGDNEAVNNKLKSFLVRDIQEVTSIISEFCWEWMQTQITWDCIRGYLWLGLEEGGVSI